MSHSPNLDTTSDCKHQSASENHGRQVEHTTRRVQGGKELMMRGIWVKMMSTSLYTIPALVSSTISHGSSNDHRAFFRYFCRLPEALTVKLANVACGHVCASGWVGCAVQGEQYDSVRWAWVTDARRDYAHGTLRTVIGRVAV